MFDTIDYRLDAGIATIRLNRPDRHNAINHQMHLELPQVWQRFNEDPAAIVAIVTGAGERAFCSGADVADLPRPEMDSADGLRWTAIQNKVWKPVICAVNGLTVGGGLHFVADADIVIAAEHASFSDSHVSVGLVAGLEPVSLARRMPLEAVLRMALMGREARLDAARAMALGMVGDVVPAGELLARAEAVARIIARNSPGAMARTKRAIWQSLELPLHAALDRAWAEIQANNAGPDFQEGIAAFRERRAPNWPPLTLDLLHE
ncbi:enoyl-CoA hydratase/isomerase family protein [Parapedomonas caeni]